MKPSIWKVFLLHLKSYILKMFEELVNRYKSYSDTELVEVYKEKDKYTDEAKRALQVAIENRGGYVSLMERYTKIVEKNNEILKIQELSLNIYSKGNNENELKSLIDSKVLTESEISMIVNEVKISVEAQKENTKIKPRTIIGGLLGAFIGGILGGILWGLQMMYSGHIFFIFGIGLFLISYAFIKLFTKQNKSNIVVFILTIVSVIFALFNGFYIYDVFGYCGS